MHKLVNSRVLVVVYLLWMLPGMLCFLYLLSTVLYFEPSLLDYVAEAFQSI